MWSSWYAVDKCGQAGMLEPCYQCCKEVAALSRSTSLRNTVLCQLCERTSSSILWRGVYILFKKAWSEMEQSFFGVLYGPHPLRGDFTLSTAYYFTCLHPTYLQIKVTSTLGRWILEECGVYSPLCGVTTNQAEGFNCVLKHLQSWKWIPVDAAVLDFYHLQAFYVNETQQGLSGQSSSLTAW